MTGLGALISAKTLAEHLCKPSNNIRVLDASSFPPNIDQSPHENYKREHIPGALLFDIEKCITESPYEHMLPSVPDFEKYVGDLGIDNGTHVVVYNNHPDLAVYSAPRVWFTFRVFGHTAVSVLDGGLRAWKNEHYEVVSKIEDVPKKAFKATYVPSLVVSFKDVVDNIESKKFQLIDGRAAGRFNGTAPEPRPGMKPGHVPGSISMPHSSVQGPLTNPDGSVTKTGVLKSKEEIQAVFESHGVDLSRPTTALCGSGMTACNLALAAYLLGKEDVSVYDGSWVEWFKRSTPQQRENCPED